MTQEEEQEIIDLVMIEIGPMYPKKRKIIL